MTLDGLIAQLRSREVQGKRMKCNVNERKARGTREVECEERNGRQSLEFRQIATLGGTQGLRTTK